MKTHAAVLVVLGFVSAVAAARSWAGDRFHEGPSRQPALSDPVQPGSVGPLLRPRRPLTESEALRELENARLALNTEIQYHGNISPQARLAMDRVHRAQAAVELARQEKESAVVQGGAGHTNGDVVSGQSPR